jgi:hypothetical protein
MSLSTVFFGNATFVDVVRGYVSMEQFLDGELFNTLNYNLESGKTSDFVAWWTPGQYILPYAIKLVGAPLWLSQGIWMVIFTGISLLGYYRLFLHFGFSKNRSLLSVLIIQTNQLFFWNTILYYGGSLFEMGLLPWFVLFLLNIKSPLDWKKAAYYVLIALGLFFLKATFLMHAGIGLAVLLFSEKKWFSKEVVWIILTGLLIASICYFGFLRFGETPSSAQDLGDYNQIPNTFWMDLSTPFVSLFGISSNIGIIIHKLFPWMEVAKILAFVFFPILAVLGILLLRNTFQQTVDTRKMTVYTLLFFFCFIYFYLSNRAISYDFRHFGPLAFCFVPFVLALVQKWVKKDWIFTSGMNILLIFNVILFGLERVEFSFSRQEFDGLYHSNQDARAFRNVIKVSKTSPADATYLIKDSWELMYHLRGKNRIPIMLKEDKWVLKSGLEVSKSITFDFAKELSGKRDLIVYLPYFSENLPSSLTGFEWAYPNVELDRNHTIFVGKNYLSIPSTVLRVTK